MNSTWKDCLALLRTKVNDHIMSTWFEPMVCEQIDADEITFSVPNSFFITWIKDNYLEIIEEALKEKTGSSFRVHLTARNDYDPSLLDEPAESALSPCPSEATTCEIALTRRLNPRYTFDSFVEGGCNQFARAAALCVAEKTGSYNPLFLYAGVGLGKTHLMNAIGYTVLARNKRARVSFCTSEEFTNEMIYSIRHAKMDDFRNKYRNVDVLLIDDIQFIAGKEGTQEEFFHTFNAIYDTSKQVVLTSDKHPSQISDLEERLISRFSCGLVESMGTPDLETKVAILKKKASEDSVNLPDEVAYFLAENCDSNTRVLVGSLVRLTAISAFQGKPISMELARACFADKLSRPAKVITVNDIIAAVSKTFNVKPADIKSKKKQRMFAFPRQIGMCLARELTELSYPDIGAAFGGRNHATVIHAAKKIEKAVEADHSLSNILDALKRDLRS
ncbi:MAG: chromosomal replication initiator protein DnaA [Thermodesulfobacteriota bacterium]